MYSEDDLNAAVASGALTQQAADALRAHTAKGNSGPAADEEHFRLVTGFNDIFVVIACLILLTSIAWIGGNVHFGLGALAMAVASWGLAEFFTRKRRMALPSILLLTGFVGGAMAAALPLAQLVLDLLHVANADTKASSVLQAGMVNFGVAGPVGAVAAWLHWRRFKVPITVAVGAYALFLFGFYGAAALLPEQEYLFSAFTFAAGVVVFIAAMRWDASDPARLTRNSDVAFWLHLLAATLLVHPVFKALGVLGGTINVYQAAAVVALYVLIALVSLVIDRRAMMVSSLGYVLFAIGSLLKDYGSIGLGFASTALLIGAALLLLSAFWQRTRQLVLAPLPQWVQRWVAPLQQSV